MAISMKTAQFSVYAWRLLVKDFQENLCDGYPDTAERYFIFQAQCP